MSWTAVTFVTPEYEHYTSAWKEHIRALGGTAVLVRMPSLRDWAKNCGQKPEAIIRAFTQINTSWFLYMDVDVKLLEVPQLPGVRRWDVGITDNLVTTHKNRISAATILFNRTAGSKKFLMEWRRRCQKQPGIDHSHLTHTIDVAKRGQLCDVLNVGAAIKWVPNGLRTEAPEEAIVTPVSYTPVKLKAQTIVAMATFPPRREGMLKVVRDLLPQCDKMYVYMNGYTEIPEEMPKADHLHCLLAGPGTGNPDKGSQGKFHWAGLDDGYYLTVDDDIHYPEGYVNYMAAGVEKYGRKCIVGLHGALFQLDPSGRIPRGILQSRARRILGYTKGIRRDRVVHTLGGGVMASYPKALGLTAAVCTGPLHSGDDEDLALWAQRNQVGMVRLAGFEDWVKPNDTEWIKDPLHRRPSFQKMADAKIRGHQIWRLHAQTIF